jgi:hypothetical protein
VIQKRQISIPHFLFGHQDPTELFSTGIFNRLVLTWSFRGITVGLMAASIDIGVRIENNRRQAEQKIAFMDGGPSQVGTLLGFSLP